jgi:ubiquinol-cytochrome c reductase iron-sulfur subunit
MAVLLVYQPAKPHLRGPRKNRRGRSKFLRFRAGYQPAGIGRQGKAMATTTGTAEPAAPNDGEGVRRRDFIEIAAVSAAGVGAAATLVPLISQMAPSKDVLAESTTEVDLSAIEPGQAIKAMFRKQPLFVRNLTQKEIDEANAVPLSELRDPQTLDERTKPGHENWLITMGVCTHLGCVPLGAGEGEMRGEFGGYFCPCHGSVYDTAARIRKGPAPTNLEVPAYEFTSDTKIVVG